MKPAAEQAPAPIPKHVLAMETALKLLEATSRVAVEAPATEVDLAPLARALERAAVAVLDAYDLRRDPLASIRDAIQACDEARTEMERAAKVDEGLAGVITWLSAARDWLHVPEQLFARTRVAPPPARDVVVSRDLPVLHRIDRPTVAPHVSVAAPIAPEPRVPTLADELAKLPAKERMAALKEGAKRLREDAAARRDERHRAAEEATRAKKADDDDGPAPGFTKGKHVAIDGDRFVRNKARELLEDIAAMGLQRAPLLGDYWRGATVFDQRMLRGIDAFAALGGRALSAVEGLVADAPSKDPMHGFAIAMVLGSFEGRDGLAAIERTVRFLGPGDADVRANVAAALKIVPHGELGPMLRQWLSDEEAGLRSIAIDVLGHRSMATTEELEARCRDEAEHVAARAFLHAALANVRELGVLIDERASAKTPDLIESLCWATALGGVPYAVDRLKKLLDEEGVSPALLPIALAADHVDALDLVRRFEKQPSRALAGALGYAGACSALGPLVDLLEIEAAPELQREAAFALQRITGAELFDDVDVPPDTLSVEDPESPPLPDDAPKLTRIASDRRDRPSDGSPDRLRLPTTRPEAWRAFLDLESVRFEGERRMRRGQPYTPVASLLELSTYQITPPERRLLYREIVIKTGEVIAFDPVDFVPVQEQALKKLGPVVEKASSVPGAWGRALRK